MVGFGFEYRLPLNTPGRWRFARVFAAVWLAAVLFGCVAVGLGMNQRSHQLIGTATVLTVDPFGDGMYFDAVVKTADGRRMTGTGLIADFTIRGDEPVVGDEFEVQYSPEPPRRLTGPTHAVPPWVFVLLGVMVVAGVAFNYGGWTKGRPFALLRGGRATGSPPAKP